MRKAVVLLLLGLVPVCWATLRASQSVPVDPGFHSFLKTWEHAQTRFINGDPTARRFCS